MTERQHDLPSLPPCVFPMGAVGLLYMVLVAQALVPWLCSHWQRAIRAGFRCCICFTHLHVMQVLMHIVTICEAEAADLLVATQQTAHHIKEALAATQPPSNSNEDEEFVASPRGSSRIDAVRAYFEEHHQRKADDAEQSGDADRAVTPGKTHSVHNWLKHACILAVTIMPCNHVCSYCNHA